MDNTPFFIVGSVRSGTTMLRNILRMHPRLESPEETHFFRWAFPYGTNKYKSFYRGSKLFKKHRELDEVDNFDFFYMLKHGNDRKELMDWYGARTLENRNNTDGRWFDKTPQNLYGILLIREYYPSAKFLHIHRHPLNVVASLVKGEVMRERELHAATNYWLESMAILNQFKQLAPERLLEIEYEEFVASPRPHVAEILNFLEEEAEPFPFHRIKTSKEKNKYRKVLSAEQVDSVMHRTERYRKTYGYD